MELTGKQKEQVEQTKDMEDTKKIVEDLGMLLDDDELDEVSGGLTHTTRSKSRPKH